MRTLVAFEEARRIVLDAARVAASEAVPLDEAVGRMLAAPVVSRGDLPPFDTSAMDGWAIRLGDVRDLPASMPVEGTVHAGETPSAPLVPGTAIAVMTGAPLPDGTEAVAPVEWGEVADGRVVLSRAPEAGQFLRRRGEALRAGETVVDTGAVVTPGAVGLLASLGCAAVTVRQRPRVAVVATGDELVEVGDTPGPGQIRNANGPGLAAQVIAAGGVVVGPLVARDTAASVSATFDACAEADVLVFAGGVSMGERDLVRTELERRGVAWAFWRVAQRPGKPLAFGTLGDRPVVGLPGNPVSAAVCFEVYVRPLLAACLGHPEPLPRPEAARLEASIPKAAGLHTFARVAARRDAEGALRLRPAGAPGSHVARSLLDADGLAHLPAAWDDAEAGAEVAFERWAWG
ncbi:MAG: gephyrin-like molybdotransferase Glp [Bacteroidota bacterium]